MHPVEWTWKPATKLKDFFIVDLLDVNKCELPTSRRFYKQRCLCSGIRDSLVYMNIKLIAPTQELK